MKRGRKQLGAKFVLDEFHLKKYIGKLERITVGEDAEKKKELEGWIREGKRKKLGEWGKEGEEKLEESLGYLKRNWEGIRRRVQKGEGGIGEQYGRTCEPCSFQPYEQPADGMEPERSGSDGKDTGISEKRGRFQEAGEAEGRNGEKGGREGIQRGRDAEMGTADTETGRDIY